MVVSLKWYVSNDGRISVWCEMFFRVMRNVFPCDVKCFLETRHFLTLNPFLKLKKMAANKRTTSRHANSWPLSFSCSVLFFLLLFLTPMNFAIGVAFKLLFIFLVIMIIVFCFLLLFCFFFSLKKKSFDAALWRDWNLNLRIKYKTRLIDQHILDKQETTLIPWQLGSIILDRTYLIVIGIC